MEEEQLKQKKSWKTIVIVAVIAGVAAIGIYMWTSGEKYESTENAQLDGDIVSMRSAVTANLEKIYFVDNQTVKKGDTLMRFEITSLEAKVKMAEAALNDATAQTKVSAGRAAASFENATASQEMAQSNAENIKAAQASVNKASEEFERTKKLLDIRAATQQQFEAVRAQLEVAKAEYAGAVSQQRSSLNSARGQRAVAQSEKEQIGTATALVEQRKAELVLALEDMKHAYILAPPTGIVAKRSVQEGNYVSVGQSLCSVVDYEHLWVTANLKETQLKDVIIGQQATIEIDAFPDLELTGTVASIGGATGAKFSLMPPDNASGNFVKVVQRVPVRIELTQAGRKDKPLYPGLSAFVKIKLK
jgi:membrane fusion protein (multidrug efflux system)